MRYTIKQLKIRPLQSLCHHAAWNANGSDANLELDPIQNLCVVFESGNNVKEDSIVNLDSD